MATLPYAASTWRPRTRLQPLGNPQVVDRFLLDRSSGVVLAGGNYFHEYVGDVYALTGWLYVSHDLGNTWQLVYYPATNGDRYSGGIVTLFSVAGPGGSYFVRVRASGVISWFTINPTLYAGDVWVDWSQDGRFWWPVQRLYHWPMTAESGSGPQAIVECGAGYVFIPGSGPGGADADWLFITVRAKTGLGTVVLEDFARWRSDDFGYSWQRVGSFSYGTSVINDVLITRNPATGRLHANLGGHQAYSDNGGLSWILTGGTVNSITFHPGNTLAGLLPGGLSSFVEPAISCDDGANWTGTGQKLGGSNTFGATVKIGPQELIAVAPSGDGGHNIWWSDSGGEVWIASTLNATLFGSGAKVAGLSLLPNGQPFLMFEDGRCGYSVDSPRGSWSPRTLCPLASAKMATAGPPALCGAPVIPSCED